MAHPVKDWTELARGTLERYDLALLREVAGRLVRPRNQWPAAELVERIVTALGNAAIIDRRIEALPPASRKLLAFIRHSREPRWRVGDLLAVLATLDETAELQPVFDLLEMGLVYPELPDSAGKLKGFEQWLGVAGFPTLAVFAPPSVTTRAATEHLSLPECPGQAQAAGAVQEADGLEWPIRLAAGWQLVSAGPIRRTQQGDFFKKDLDRITAFPVLGAAPADALGEIPDAGSLAIELGAAAGLLDARDGQLVAGRFPPEWDRGLPEALEALWSALLRLENWSATEGSLRQGSNATAQPATYVLALLCLSRLPADRWASATAVQQWVHDHYPHGIAQESDAPERSFFLGLAYSLRLVQAAKGKAGDWLVRLSPMGRRVLDLGRETPALATYAQTLLVQPNLEIVAYRQGLTTALVARLTLLANWKALGAACTLQLQPESIYRALEAGLSFEAILQTLERHGMRPTPPAVVESIRTWANKRERLTVYPSATLFEFHRPEDLNDALARGLPAQRLTDRLAIITSESGIDYRHFRLVGTRDYALPPDQCVKVRDDGVTLEVDVNRSDLMLETELRRFADGGESSGEERREFRLSPESLRRGHDNGMSLRGLEEWFLRRTGQGLSPAARMILTGHLAPPLRLERLVVLHAPSPEVADGLLQWPATRALIRSRLGPTALVIDEGNVARFKQQAGLLGLTLIEP